MVLGLAIALVTLCCLLLLGMPAVVHQEQERADARYPVQAAQDASGRLQYGEAASSWRGQDITRVLVAGPEDAPAPGGLTRLPRIGRVAMSPALADLTRKEPTVRAYFHGWKRVGNISTSGLLRPDELRAVMGVTRRHSDVQPVEGFGSVAPPVQGETGAFVVVALVYLLLILGPAVALVFVATRLSAKLRDSRLVALRQLGVGPIQLGIIVAIETGAVAALGSLVGLAGFLLLRTQINRVPWVDATFYPADLDVSVALSLLVVVGIPLAATTCSVLSAPRPSHHSVRPNRQIAKRRSVSTLLLLLGLAAVAINPLMSGFVPAVDQFRIFMLGAAAIALGIPLGLPFLVQRMAAATAARARQPGTIVGLRWSAADPGAATRLGAGMCVAVFALGVAMPVLALLQGDPSSGRSGLSRSPTTELAVTDDVNAPVTTDALRRADGVEAAIPVVSMQSDGGSVPALVASCDDLERLATSSAFNCPKSLAWVSTSSFPTEQLISAYSGPLHLRKSLQFPLPSPRHVVDLPLGPDFDGALVIPPSLAGDFGRIRSDVHMVSLNNQADTQERFEAYLASVAPSATISNGYQDWIHQAAAFSGPIRWVELGLTLGLLLAVLSLAMASVGDAVERRRRVAATLVLGAPKTFVLKAHVVSTFVPLAVGTVVAVGAGWLCALVFAANDERAAVSGWNYLLLFICVMSAMATTTALTSPVALRPLGAREVRQE